MFSRVNLSHEGSNMREGDFEKHQRMNSFGNIYANPTLQSDQFSFKQQRQNRVQSAQESCEQMLYKSESTISLKQNLEQLSKQEIIEILLQEINSSTQGSNNTHNNTKGKSELNDTLSAFFSVRNDQGKYKRQYEELVRGFEEYINNTRQAQEHYVKVIDELKRENKSLQSHSQSSSSSTKNTPTKHSPLPSHHQSTQKPKLIISKLQQTVQNYIKINNQLINKTERLQRINKELNQETSRLNEDCQNLQQQLEMLERNNHKLNKENQSFKAVVEELKDYIMESREAKQLADSMSDTQRSNKSMYDDSQQDQKNAYVNLPKNSEDSLINSSEIKRQELTLNDSTIVFEKQTNLIQNPYLQTKGTKRQTQTNQRSLSHQSSIDQFSQVNITTYRTMKVQNKELRLANLKLQQLMDSKGEKIRSLLEEIHTLREQRILVSQEIIQLKCRLKKMEHCSNSESTMGSKCTASQSKVSLGSTGYNHTDRKSSQFYCKESHMDQKTISSPSQSVYQFRKKQSECFEPYTQHDENPIIQAKENVYSQKVSMRVQRLLGKEYNEQPICSKINETFGNAEQYYAPKALLFSNKKF